METVEIKQRKQINNTIAGIALGFFLIVPVLSSESLIRATAGFNRFDQVMTAAAIWAFTLFFSLRLARSVKAHAKAALVVMSVCGVIVMFGGSVKPENAGLAAAFTFTYWTASMLAGWLASWATAGIISKHNEGEEQ